MPNMDPSKDFSSIIWSSVRSSARHVGQPGEKKYKIMPFPESIPSSWLIKLTLAIESSAAEHEINKESKSVVTRRKLMLLIAKT